MRMMKHNENKYSNVSPSVHFPEYPCSHVAARLKGKFLHISGIGAGASCSFRQMVYAVFKLTAWSRAVKDSSAAFVFEGEGWLSSSRLDAASVDLLMAVRTQAKPSTQHWRCAQNGYRKLADTQNSALHCSYEKKQKWQLVKSGSIG